MATATAVIRVYPDATARDAVLGWENGDVVILLDTGITVMLDDEWVTLATLDDIPAP